MADTGYAFVGSGATGGGAGNAWITPGNVTADDAAYATTAASDGGTSERLDCEMVTPFAVPSDATIDGVACEYQRSKQNATNAVVTTYWQLRQNAALIGTQQSQAGAWEASDTVKTIGGATDKMGATLTPAIVNDTDFGISFWVTFEAGEFPTGSIRVDYVKLKIFYTPASTGKPTHTVAYARRRRAA